ncbi:MAG: hypothetical protein H7Z12_08970 [Rhodospirillaceae bacterium]|nr:hypothetical protein [Rhodospirillales bacterium]
MAIANALSEDAVLFNAYVGTHRTDAAGMRGLVFRLRPQVKKAPTNVLLLTALAGALLHAGDVNAGTEKLEAAYRLRDYAPYACLAEIASLHSGIGEYERASELFRQVTSGTLEPSVVANSAFHSLASGDLGMLEAALALAEPFQLKVMSNIVTAKEILAQNKLLDSLAGHQYVVRSVLTGHRCFYSFRVSDEGGEQPFISYDHFVVGDRKVRSRLSIQLFDALFDYYEAQGQDGGAFVSVLVDDILPMEMVG